MPNRLIRDVIAGQSIKTAAADLSVLEAAKAMADAHIGSLLIVDGQLYPLW